MKIKKEDLEEKAVKCFGKPGIMEAVKQKAEELGFVIDDEYTTGREALWLSGLYKGKCWFSRCPEADYFIPLEEFMSYELGEEYPVGSIAVGRNSMFGSASSFRKTANGGWQWIHDGGLICPQIKGPHIPGEKTFEDLIKLRLRAGYTVILPE